MANSKISKFKLSSNEISEMNHFDHMAQKYDVNYGYKDKFTLYKINKKIKEFKKFVKSSIKSDRFNIVEFGCGTGEYTKLIAQSFPKAKIIALDISDDMLGVARRKCVNNRNVTFLNASAYTTECKDNSIDVVCGFYILHHINTNKVFKEINRILKFGGAGYFFEPNILNPVVYAIKSIKFLKKLAGDSPEEWAINPLKIVKVNPKLNITVDTFEYILPLKFIPTGWLILIDKLSLIFRYIPIFKYLGGSVAVKVLKLNN